MSYDTNTNVTKYTCN